MSCINLLRPALCEVGETFTLILVAALVKAMILCFLFVYFGRRLLGEPLSRVVTRLRGLPLEASSGEDNNRVCVDELQLLEVAITTMEAKLAATLGQLSEANEQLTESNEVLQRATEQNPAAITIFDPDGRVVYTNPSFSRISGYAAEEAQHAYDRCLYQEAPLPEKIRALTLQGPLSNAQIEACNDGKDGHRYWSSTRLTPVRDDAGKISHMLVISLDITALKQTALALADKTQEQQVTIQQLEEAQHQLVQSEKLASIGQLAAGVAHEINNPVGYVNSNLSSLAQYAKDMLSVIDAYDNVLVECHCGESTASIKKSKDAVDFDFLREDLDHLLHESKEGIDRVKKIIQDLKDFSRADQGEWVMSDLHKGIESTLNVVWNELKYKAEVVKTYGDLPLVHCIPSQLNQVFMNLLVNAAHAIAERGVIRIQTGIEKDRVWVDISDNGKGIAAENMARLFEPFLTTKAIGKGTGLGLSVSYGIVKRHGGEIEVESTPGDGSRFRVWIPVSSVDAIAA